MESTWPATHAQGRRVLPSAYILDLCAGHVGSNFWELTYTYGAMMPDETPTQAAPDNPMQPVLDKFESGTDVLLFAYMSETRLSLKDIKKVTVQRGRSICVHMEPKEK